MSTVSEIKRAVQKLSRRELQSFCDWLFGFDAAAGRLDALADEALRDLREGRCTNL